MIGISGSGGSAGPAVSGGGQIGNSADIVFGGGSVGGSGTAGMSLGTWALIAAAAGLATFFLVKHM